MPRLEPEVQQEEGNGDLMKAWHPDKFDSRHRLVAQLHAAGLKNVEIEAVTGYSTSRVSVILHDPRAREVIRETESFVSGRIDDVALRLQLLANEALDKITDLMRDSTDEHVVQRSAFSILDRAGYGKIEKQISIQAQISDKAAEVLASAAVESRVVEADYSIED